MVYPRAFFELQLGFAERAAALAGVSRERALLDYTNLYVRLGLGRDFEAGHPGWQACLAGLRSAEDAGRWTHERYLRDAEARTAPVVVESVGCFSAALPTPGLVRLHFRNAETDGGSPLAAGRAGRRRAELAALCERMAGCVGDDARVVGASWLYQLEAYRRLFPPEYVATARVRPGGFRSMALWGQLLDHHGAVKAPLARAFRQALARAASVEELETCFPFRVLTVEAPLGCFRGFYGRRAGPVPAAPSSPPGVTRPV